MAMGNARGRKGAGVQRAPLKTAVGDWVATNGGVLCDAGNGRPALMRTFRGVYTSYVHSTGSSDLEGQCSKCLTKILRVARGIVCPEYTPKAFVAKAVGADTSTAV